MRHYHWGWSIGTNHRTRSSRYDTWRRTTCETRMSVWDWYDISDNTRTSRENLYSCARNFAKYKNFIVSLCQKETYAPSLWWRGKSGHRRGVFPNLRANGSSCIGDYMVWKVPQRLNSAMIIREKNSFIVPRWKVSAALFLAEKYSSNRNTLVNPRWCKWVGSASAEGSCLSQEAISDLERYMSRYRIRLITSGFK